MYEINIYFVRFWVSSCVEKFILEMRLFLDPSEVAYVESSFVDFGAFSHMGQENKKTCLRLLCM